MSDLSTTSYCKDNKNDNGISPMLLILLLCMCQGNGGLFGGNSGNDGCSLCGGGMDGILPILLILLMSGGSF